MKILLVQLSFLGDTILSTPLIGAILRRYPACELSVLTTPHSAELLLADPRIKKIHLFDKRSKDRGFFGILRTALSLKLEKFDLVYSLHRSWRTALLLWLTGIPKRIGFKESNFSWLYTDRVARLAEGHAVLKSLSLLGEIDPISEAELLLFTRPDISLPTELNGKRYILLAPGSVWKTKRWGWRGYRQVAEHYRGLGFNVVLTGAKSEAELGSQILQGLPNSERGSVIDLIGKLSLSELLTVAKNARLIVCNDSMVLHIASAFKVPTVAVFCATSPNFGFGPWQNHARVVEREGLACKPCARHGSQRCPTGTELCMNEILSTNVIAAAKEVAHE